jgi:hypothetical protein
MERRCPIGYIYRSLRSIDTPYAGVFQGSCIFPTIYLTYINDIPMTFKASLSLFANNTMFLSTDKNPKRAARQLQHQLDNVITWFHRWRIKINSFKTVVGVIFGRTNTTHILKLTLDNQTVNWSKQT